MGIAFVSGASRGLGREVARGLVAAGHQVIGISKDAQRAAETGAQLGIPFLTTDFQDIEATRRASQTLLEKYGTPEILVLAHGVMSDKMAKTLRTNDQEWGCIGLLKMHGCGMAHARADIAIRLLLAHDAKTMLHRTKMSMLRVGRTP